jgi:hypothetical protein
VRSLLLTFPPALPVCLSLPMLQPWHQDAAYLDPTADHTLQLTAWIPFLDATVQNGCMQVVRGGHRPGVVVDHTGCAGATWYIETVNERMQQSLGLDVEANVVTVPVPLGSVLLLNNLIPHRSLNNASDDIRWSIDLRWQRPDKPSGYALKPLLPLTKKDEPGFSPDWEHWRQQDRHQIVKQSLTQQPQQQQASPADEFDTTIVGVTSSAPVPHCAAAAACLVSPSSLLSAVSAVDEPVAADSSQSSHPQVGGAQEIGLAAGAAGSNEQELKAALRHRH